MLNSALHLLVLFVNISPGRIGNYKPGFTSKFLITQALIFSINLVEQDQCVSRTKYIILHRSVKCQNFRLGNKT